MNSISSSATWGPVIPIPPNLPVGFKFNPTDEELIGYYLEMLLLGLYSDNMPIGFVEFLEFEPWELPGRSRMKSDDQVWYFFCSRIVYMNRKKKMYKRKTGVGHWHPTGYSTIENLGKITTLRFYKKDSPKEKTEWIAYEYEITQSSILPNPGEFVIIKLVNDSSGEKRTKKKTNTIKQHLKKTLTSTYNRNTSLDEVTTMSDSCSREVFTDFGNQNVVNTTAMPTYSIHQQCIQKDTPSEGMATISYGSHVVSSDFEYQNPTKVTSMSTYDIGESSSQATFGCQNHSSIIEGQETEYFPRRVYPYILDNQEENEQSNCIFASDFENQKLSSEVEDSSPKKTPCTDNQFENQKLPSEVEDSPPKATPRIENQLPPDETNPSCSMTSRLEDDFQNEELDLSFLEDDELFSLMDLDSEIS